MADGSIILVHYAGEETPVAFITAAAPSEAKYAMTDALGKGSVAWFNDLDGGCFCIPFNIMISNAMSIVPINDSPDDDDDVFGIDLPTFGTSHRGDA